MQSCMVLRGTQGCLSSALVRAHKSSLWGPSQACLAILYAIKSIYFNWIMTPIFEPLENPSPPPFVSAVADFQYPDSGRAFVLPVALEPPGAKDQFAIMNLICLV